MVEELEQDEKHFVRLRRHAICILKRIRSFASLECTNISRNTASIREAGVRQHPLYAPGGTASVLALAVARRQREIIGNSLYTSAR
jgi:hypothetical protein